MPYFETICQDWLASGHRVKDFAHLTELDQSYCSQIFNGKRTPNAETLSQILERVEPVFAQKLLQAWIKDQIDKLPLEWKDRVEVLIINNEDKLREESPLETDSASKARAWALRSLDSDPKFFEMIRGLYDLMGQP